MRGRGPVQELFLDGVPVEPGDGGQPPGDGGAGATHRFELSGEGLDVGAADGEQREVAGAAPAGELAQVQHVGFTGQAAVPGQEPGEGDPLGIGEDGWIVERSAVVIGHLPARLEPGSWASPGPSSSAETHRKPDVQVTLRQQQAGQRPFVKCSMPIIYGS